MPRQSKSLWELGLHEIMERMDKKQIIANQIGAVAGAVVGAIGAVPHGAAALVQRCFAAEPVPSNSARKAKAFHLRR